MRQKFLTVMGFFLILGFSLHAADKSGASSRAVSLPSGPGSVGGMGQAFQVMGNTGESSYAIVIAVPAVANNNAPGLSLSYSSSRGDGLAGIGWNVGAPSITRQVDQGMPLYVDQNNGVDDDFDGVIDNPEELDTFLGLTGSELVKMTDGSYRERDGGSFARYHRLAGKGWEMESGEGRRFFFGSSAASQVTAADGTSIYQWNLEKQVDIYGNTIEYSYQTLPGSDNQKYLAEVRYAPGAPPWQVFYLVHFAYENRPHWTKSYKSGFLIKKNHRLKQIDVAISGKILPHSLLEDLNGDGQVDSLIRRYLLEYGEKTSAERFFLKKVTQYGADGVNYLPPFKFSYAVAEPPSGTRAIDKALKTTTNTPIRVPDDLLVDFLDVNGDALPDLLQTEQSGGRHQVMLNEGEHNGSIRWSQSQDMAASESSVYNLTLGNNQVYLADMDGDGLADLVQKDAVGEVSFYGNRGDLHWKNKQKMFTQDTVPPSPYADPKVRFMDVDFNKRVDILKSSETGYSIWMNLGNGKYSREQRVAGATYNGKVINFDGSGVYLADLNGDRMNDVVYVSQARIVYAANMGYGRFDTTVAVSLPDWELPDGALARIGIEDVNGDGLADILIERAQTGKLWYWLNLGNDSFSAKYVLTGLPSVFGENTKTRWADLNGSGTIDLIYADNTAAERLRYLDIGALISGSTHANLLTHIEPGNGADLEYQYESSVSQMVAAAAAGKAWKTKIPQPLHLLSKTITRTGLDVDSVPGEDTYETRFTYYSGYYDPLLKAFRGFAQTEQLDVGGESPSLLTTGYYHTSAPDGVDNDGDQQIDEVSQNRFREEEALKGKVYKIERRQVGGRLFTVNEIDWKILTLDQGVNPSDELRRAIAVETRVKTYEGTDTPELLKSTFTYDLFGNVLTENNQGALSMLGDERIEEGAYINDTARWILGILYRSRVKDGAGNLIGEVRHYYDGSDFVGLPLGTLTKGQLMRTEYRVDDKRYLNAVSIQYDLYGNIIKTLNGRGFATRVEFDPDLHTYPVREIQEVGGGKADLVTSAAYHLGFGMSLHSIDVNGQAAFLYYDVFGRLTKTIGPQDSNLYPSTLITYRLADPRAGLLYWYDEYGNLFVGSSPPVPNMILTATRENHGESGTSDVLEYTDSLGRKLGSVHKGNQDEFMIVGATLFDDRGQAQHNFSPYPSVSQEYLRPDLALPHASTSYDGLGRPVVLTGPLEESGFAHQVRTEHWPLYTRSFDEENHAHNTYFDGMGRIIEHREENFSAPNDPGIYVTTYQYNALGNLLQVIDAQQNIKTIQYDGLGRQVWWNDLDKGLQRYAYDDENNIIRTEDAKGQVILYTYDGLNRILSVDYLDTTKKTPDVSYYYDTPAPDYPQMTNLKGNLSYVRHLSGTDFYSYDERGWLVAMVRRVGVNDGVVMVPQTDYAFSSTFNALGKVISSTFPDGEQLTYHYNSRRLIQAIASEGGGTFLEEVAYTPLGTYEKVRYGNGVETSYTYDRRNRLKTLNTISSNDRLAEIQRLEYYFNGKSNIIAVLDGRAVAPNSPQNLSQTFEYDDLGRLLVAKGSYGMIQYRHDKIGNLIYKASPTQGNPEHIADALINLGTMSYGGPSGTSNRLGRAPGEAPGPHALTSTKNGTDNGSGFHYDYDDNGNLVRQTWTDGTPSQTHENRYSWDFKDQLTAFIKNFGQENEQTTRYYYDAAGERTIKVVGVGSTPEITIYVSKDYEIRNFGRPEAKEIKSVFMDQRKIVNIQKGGVEVPPTKQTLNFQSGWNFFSLTIRPDDLSIASVLAPLAGQYTKVVRFDDENYQIYLPGQASNPFNSLVSGRGYLIEMKQSAALTIKGTWTPRSQTLKAGWNLIASNNTGAVLIEEALASIRGKYSSIWAYQTEAQTWKVFLPEAPLEKTFINTLTAIEPGKAFWINMKEDATLSFLRDSQRQITFLHPDHLGSANTMTNAKGDIVSEIAYYPFGRPRYEQHNGVEVPYKYTGKELDNESGLMYFGARYYDAITGRFVSVDPLFVNTPGGCSIQECNLYAYAANNPINRIDPDGRASSDVHYYSTAWVAMNIFGYSSKDADTIARANLSVDEQIWFKKKDDMRPGTDFFSPESSGLNKHALAGKLANGRQQTAVEALDAAAGIVNGHLAAFQKGGGKDLTLMGRPMHTAQDMVTEVHGGRRWFGAGWMMQRDSAETIFHMAGDDRFEGKTLQIMLTATAQVIDAARRENTSIGYTMPISRVNQHGTYYQVELTGGALTSEQTQKIASQTDFKAMRESVIRAGLRIPAPSGAEIAYNWVAPTFIRTLGGIQKVGESSAMFDFVEPQQFFDN